MAGIVLTHLAITVVHGSAHTNARVGLSPAQSVFVFAVILAGPLIGLGFMWPYRRIGAALVGVAMVGALVFGIVNHFVLSSPDNVTHVDPQWRPLFATTAVLLAATEVVGSLLAIQAIREWRRI
jgi:hypothetical protein